MTTKLLLFGFKHYPPGAKQYLGSRSTDIEIMRIVTDLVYETSPYKNLVIEDQYGNHITQFKPMKPFKGA
jgi:hypothetical protein